MEPEPIITRAFSLVAQEVEQRASAVLNPASTLVAVEAKTLLAKTSSFSSNTSNSSA